MTLLLLVASMAGAPVPFTVSQQAVEGGSLYLQVATGDVNGDGLPDQATLKLDCKEGAVASAWVSAREASSGMATGRRQYAPVRIIKEWGPASPSLRSSKGSYDVKKMEGAKTSAMDDWSPVSLNGLPPGICADGIVKSKSNITNN